MSDTIVIVSTVLAVLTLLLLLHGYVTRRIDIFSFRSLFLLGMIQFYFLALALIPSYGLESLYFTLSGQGLTTLAYLMPPFMLIYLIGTHYGGRLDWPSRWVPTLALPITIPGMMVCYIGMAFLVGLTFVVAGARYSEALLFQVRPMFVASMAGLATAMVIARPRQPFFWALLACTFVAALVTSMLNANDRRMPLSVFLAVPWVAYFLYFRYKSHRVTFTAALGAFTLAAIFLLGYTNIRHNYNIQTATPDVRTDQLKDIVTGKTPLLSADNFRAIFWQDSAPLSAWIIEHYGEDIPLIPFNGIYQFLVLPIPREIWPDKPTGIGTKLQAHLSATANLAPGIIGHGWSEGKYFGVAGYALFFGFFCGIIDRLLRERASNPYFLVAIGGGLGNIIGLPRGETFHFLAQWFSAFAATVILCWVLAAFLRPVMAAAVPIHFGPHDPDEPEPEDDEQLAYGPAALAEAAYGE